MASDMRLDLNFVDHPKVRRLIHLAGYEGFYGLIRLFSIAGRMYTDGVFKGCEKEVLEGFAEWRKDESFVDILVKVGFIKKKGAFYEIHDWKDHQPWLFWSEKRSNIAKAAANARWNKSAVEAVEHGDTNDNLYGKDASRMLDVCDMHAQSNAASNAPSPFPSPIPSPYPTPIPIPNPSPFPTQESPLPPKGGKAPVKERKRSNYITDEQGTSILEQLLPEGNFRVIMIDFISHRREINKPMTERSLTALVSQLQRDLATDSDRIACVELSIANGWQGVFPKKIYQRVNSSGRHPGSKEGYQVDISSYETL